MVLHPALTDRFPSSNVRRIVVSATRSYPVTSVET